LISVFFFFCSYLHFLAVAGRTRNIVPQTSPVGWPITWRGLRRRIRWWWVFCVLVPVSREGLTSLLDILQTTQIFVLIRVYRRTLSGGVKILSFSAVFISEGPWHAHQFVMSWIKINTNTWTGTKI
jgi:hypothetical protein